MSATAPSVRGLVFRGPERPPTVENLLLDAPGPGEVEVRMLAAGVCHSDLHVVDGEWQRPPNVVMGHEGAGIVEALGPGVQQREADAPYDAGGVRVGDLVALAWTAPCGDCALCRRGEDWLCRDPRGASHRLEASDVRLHTTDGSPLGAYSGVGTFCTRQVVAVEAAVPIDPATPPSVAALIGCAASTGVGAVRNTAQVRAGEAVAVIGLGGVGLAALLAAIEVAAHPVIAVDVEPAKRAIALKMGATDAIGPDELAKIASALTAGGVDHALECIGLVEAARLAVDSIRVGGTATLVGMAPVGDAVPIEIYGFVEDGKRLLGSNYGSSIPSRDFKSIAADVASGRLPLAGTISEAIGLDDIEAAFEAMRRRDGSRRVVLFEDQADQVARGF